MKPKIVTSLILALLLSNIIVTAFATTPVFAKIFNSSPKNETISDKLLEGVDFSETTQSATDSTNNQLGDFWDLSQKNELNNNINYWSQNSTEFIVGLSEALGSYEKIEQLALAKYGKVINRILMGGKVRAVVVEVPKGSYSILATEAKKSGFYRYVEPNLQYHTFMVPNDPDWTLQWGPQKIQADYAWNTTVGSKSVVVCVIDTGVDYLHPDLQANYLAGGYDWVNSDPDPMDDNGHGTHCAGIVGAVINNSVGIAGVANVSIMAEKGLDASGSGYYDDLANAIVHATDQNADIISMSWGGSSGSSVILDALRYAYDNGVLLVAAAGNTGTTSKHYPAAYDEVIAVSATDQSDTMAGFSTHGDWIELSAPGYGIYSTISSTHYPAFTYPYDFLSGTSMACPHVAGVAALVLSRLPNMARDVLTLHLEDTADDLGTLGFDIYYGYGRINARKAVEQPLPEHDLIVTSWKRPPYVEPGNTGTINATICNYGRSNETNVSVQLLVNGTLEQSVNTDFVSGTLKIVSFSWAPLIIGNYNVTIYVQPVVNETKTVNNVVQGFIYVDFPLKVFVLRSSGTQYVTEGWDVLNYNWQKYGDQLIYVDSITLDKDNITYEDLNATNADVLILSCSFAWEYTDEEIEAIRQYVYEGHGFIATAGTFYYQVPNNNNFASMFGLNESMVCDVIGTDMLQLLNPAHPVFAGVPNPYVMPAIQTSYPYDRGGWTSDLLAGGTYVAMGYYNESAIVVYQGLVFISPWLEAIPEQYHFNFQILYNAITWSQYSPPEHDLRVSLEVPEFMFPGDTVLLNATVSNNGLQDETDVDLYLSIVDVTRNKTEVFLHKFIPSLPSGDSSTLDYLWNPILAGLYNVTAYSPPVVGEGFTDNNKATVMVTISPPLIEPLEGQWTRYSVYSIDSMGQQVPLGKLGLNYSEYISSYQMNVTLFSSMYGSNATDWTVVNIVNRYCESGAWQGYWFPGMIETNISLGSGVNVLFDTATVIGSETLLLGRRIVDCWQLYQNFIGTEYWWWFDKTTGLWIRYDAISGSNRQIIMLDETSIPVGFLPEHELFVTLQAPTFMEFGGSSKLNATVANLGKHNETNVKLRLEINDTIVASESIPKLAVNQSYTTSYSWTPPNEALYNVTAYSPPVSGENLTLDNAMTVWVDVKTVKGRVLFDQTHSVDSILNYHTWVSNLQEKGYKIDTHTSGIITPDVLEGYDAFVTIQVRSSYSVEEINAIRGFVADGGGLLVVGDDYPSIYTALTGFADISWTHGGSWGYTTNITPHEVTQGVNTVYLSGPEALMYVSGRAQSLIRDNYYSIMLSVNWYECGRVMGFADEDSLADYSISGADNLRLATNMIQWLCEEDTTPPYFSYILPFNGTIIANNTVTLRWLALDVQSGIAKYSIYLNEQFVANTTLQSYMLFSLVEGANNITIVAYDKVGNNASGKISIIVDLTPPTIGLLSPANNSCVRQTVAIDVSGSDEHFDRMELYIDAEHLATFNTSGTHSYLWDTSAELFGVHKMLLVGYDVVGNDANATITVTVDNLAPTVVIISPTNNAYVSGNINTVFIAQDFALKNASMMIGDTVIIDVTGETSHQFDTTILSAGSYAVKLVAYDLAGNKAETSVTVTIDNVQPTVQIVSPAISAHVKGAVNVTFAFSDLNLERASLAVAGGIFDVTSTTFHLWNTVDLADGSYTLTLTVSDKAGNDKTVQITVVVDNTAPLGEFHSPLNGAYIKGTINITFYGYDIHLDIIKLNISGGVLVYNWNVSGIHSRLWDTTSPSPDGSYTIKVEIYDKAGNLFAMAVNVIADNTLPVVSIDSPQDNASLSGIVAINFSVSDSNLVDVVLFIDGARYPVGGQTSFQWNTTRTLDGDHTIKIVATDWAGNTKEATVQVKTSNAPPFYMTILRYAAVGLLGLAVGVLIVWLILKRKLSTPA